MRIAIVNDSPIIIELLIRVLTKKSEHVVAWTAHDGAEAVLKCSLDKPDLILMDLVMPKMDGALATYYIMEKYPCAILIMTPNVSNSAGHIFEAMGHGALDAVNTPELNEDLSESVDLLLKKIHTIATLLGKDKKLQQGQEGCLPYADANVLKFPSLLIIGASTGGPLALLTVLKKISKESDLAVVIIQHVDVKFAGHLARWLKEQTSLPVELALEGCYPEKGKVLIANTAKHLVFNKKQQLIYSNEPKSQLYKPSIDVFFSSAARYWPRKAMAVLLTGMGSDGAKGLKHLRSCGWYTVAEHESSCIVYGMPRAAVECDAAVAILRLEDIGTAIIEMHKNGY